MSRTGSLPLVAVLLLPSCGGSPGAPTPVPSPSAAPVATHTIAVTVYYDQNANQALDADEAVRMPRAVVVAGAGAATADASGRASLTLPAGTHTLTVRADSLPPYYRAGTGALVELPRDAEVRIPVTLPIGSNRPNVYMAFGDSITLGEGSSDLLGYRAKLGDRLRAHFGAAAIVNEGISATRSNRGALRIRDSLDRTRPAFALIHYGTNDWNDVECRRDDLSTCFTVESLRTIVRECKATQTLPFLGTIIPVNVLYEPDGRTPPERNEWVALMDAGIRRMAAEEGVVVVDLEKAFLDAAQGNINTLARLYDDHVHPNDAGYQIMVDTFFQAITGGRIAAAADAPPVLLPLEAPFIGPRDPRRPRYGGPPGDLGLDGERIPELEKAFRQGRRP